jgi:hypothetical protein
MTMNEFARDTDRARVRQVVPAARNAATGHNQTRPYEMACNHAGALSFVRQ